MKKNGMSCDIDTLMYMGDKYYQLIAGGKLQLCIETLSSIGLTSDNINMLIKYGTMCRYKNTLQKKIKKEYDRCKGKAPKRQTKEHIKGDAGAKVSGLGC
jgi:hypothetical protein